MAIYLGNTLLTGPSGGTGDAVLADDQTFTGRNTFTDTAIFSNTGSDGSIQVAERIVHQGDEDTRIIFSNNDITLDAGGTGMLRGFGGGGPFIQLNQNRAAVDMFFGKQTTGDFLSYSSVSDTLTLDADNLIGVAGSETGTWTPTFFSGGTQGTTNATYSKSGQNVIVDCQVAIAASGSPSTFNLSIGSLPFTLNNSAITIGSYYMASSDTDATTISGVTQAISGGVRFLDNSLNRALRGNELLGYIGFTLTYTTTD